MHNAPFDVGFIDNELKLVGMPPLDSMCRSVFDTLPLDANLLAEVFLGMKV
jgi:DNA polymerase-3 subunit epsilon